ncbi:unnamed protein product [Schistosoma margrebowiei]|uniref:Uncharacterized protein n=1 Tax=Schistosoma margrebowiei TaxID=48269 RepID=A0A183M4G3_9TREM|nr:unnamed protein product [Schistosoma margrebowiei]
MPVCKKGQGPLVTITISLANIVFKILASTILGRLTKAREEQTRENQAGFRPGHGCIDQIFILRQCKNPCIIHGFTILSAVFRGRLTRQLLATRKVHDLIRTVKDTAKLILSIRLDQSNISFQSEFISTNQTIHQLTDNELLLLLESKLLIQLYHILNEIHEIFFKWSITKQISLICNSNASLYKMNYSSTKTSTTNSSRILRQLQPHQVNSLPKSKQISNNANGKEK